MPEPICAHTRPDGTPCAARPLPGRPFCLFHDPDHAAAQTEARRKGGAAPRRRLRRFPRLLDYQHVAELLSELFIASLNDPAAIDCKRLQALTTLARTLLKAVGTPSDTYMEHDDRVEPTPAADHLLRIYPPLPLEIEALLAAEPTPAEPTPAEPTPAPAVAPAAAAGPATPAAADCVPLTSLAAAPEPPAPGDPHLPTRSSPSSDPSDATDPSNLSNDPQAATTAEQVPEQAPNWCGTGASVTDTLEHQSPSTQNPPSDVSPTAAPIVLPPPASPSPSADEALPEPEPRHILVDPHAPWPTADTLRPTRGYVLVDLPFDPTRRFAR